MNIIFKVTTLYRNYIKYYLDPIYLKVVLSSKLNEGGSEIEAGNKGITDVTSFER